MRSARSPSRCESEATGRGWPASGPLSRSGGRDGQDGVWPRGGLPSTSRLCGRTMKQGRSRDPSWGTAFGRRFGASINSRLLPRRPQLRISRLRSSPPDTAATLVRPDSVQAIVHRSGETLPVLSLGRLDLCSVEVCASFGVAHYRAGKLPQGYWADTDSSTHRPYRRLCAAALGNRFWAWVA